MKLDRLWLVAFMFLSSACSPSRDYSSLLETTIDNGGDLVTCVQDLALKAESERIGAKYFEGTFTLDYLVTYNPLSNNSGIADLSSWDEYSSRMSVVLARAWPAGAQSWEHFLASRTNTSDPTASRRWRPSAFDLTHFTGHQLVQSLPRNCIVDHDGEPAIRVTQMVRRMQSVGEPIHIQYLYDHRRLQDLKTESAMQYSFLLVHEWLWDVTDDPVYNRQLNHDLHDAMMETINPARFMAMLQSYNANLYPLGSELPSVAPNDNGSDPGPSTDPISLEKPRWDAQTNRLFLGEDLILEINGSSLANQRAREVVELLQDRNWVRSLDLQELLNSWGLDSRDNQVELHRTIDRLNDNHVNPGILLFTQTVPLGYSSIGVRWDSRDETNALLGHRPHFEMDTGYLTLDGILLKWYRFPDTAANRQIRILNDFQGYGWPVTIENSGQQDPETFRSDIETLNRNHQFEGLLKFTTNDAGTQASWQIVGSPCCSR